MNKVILAIDGGATKTAITVRKRDGTVLFDGQGEGSNYQTSGEEKVKGVLADLLADVQSVLPDLQADIAVFALAGIDSERDEMIVRSIVKEVCLLTGFQADRLIVENDAEATMLGATGTKPGALLISGTGSIAYAHNGKGKIVRSGGWGHRAGDEGSGYWMGREALRAIFRMEDGRGQVTSLKAEVLKELQLDSVQELAGWLFGPEYSVDRVAKLSPILSMCISIGDAVAIRIMEEAADELSLLIDSVLRACSLDNVECDVYLNGGAITHFETLKLGLEKRLKANIPLCKIVTSTKSPLEYIVERGWWEVRR